MTSSWKRETKLLLSSDSEDEDNGPGPSSSSRKSKGGGGSLVINKDYASRYESWRGKEEIQKFKDRFGASSLEKGGGEGDSSESSSSESDVEELVNDKQFLKALSCLKKKDPIIYDEKLNFFPENPTTTTATRDTKKAKKIDKKPFLLKDHERKMILEIDPEAEDEVLPVPEPKISYYQEQNDIKSKITAVTSKVSEDEDDGDLLLKARAKSSGEVAAEDEEYKKWLKGQVDKLEGGSTSKADEKELKYLRDYWNDPKLDEGEQFLRDYILNRKYVDTSAVDKDDHVPTYDEIVGRDGESEDDEAELEKMEEFEQKFNFRFEEPDQEFIKKYPRTVENSIRRKETKRKEERERVREARKKEKERKATEIQQLKAFSRKQILDKIRLLQESSGDAGLGFTDADVDGDFDPDEYDSRTHTIFNDEFYSNCVDEEKPVFSDMDYDEEDEGEEIGQNFDNVKNLVKIENHSDNSDAEAGFSGEVRPKIKGKKQARKGKRVLEALDKEKSKLSKLERKHLEEEYFKLDFEDIIGGDIPCRFKYREVVPNDFGLTTEEILSAPDKELNRWSSIKKTYLHRSEEEELYDLHAYGVKKNDFRKKKRLLASLYAPEGDGEKEEDEDEVHEQPPEHGSKKKKRKKQKNKNEATEVVKIKEAPSDTTSSSTPSTKTKRKRKNKNKNKNGAVAVAGVGSETKAVNGSGNTSTTATPSGNKKKRNKNKNKGSKNEGVTKSKPAVPVVVAKPDRLAAFGINPKKYEKWVKYGGANASSTATTVRRPFTFELIK